MPRALTDSQKRYISAIKNNIITFGVGPAGTGKTYVAAALACEAFAKKEISNIIVTRPVMEVGRSLGFLPGTLQEKYHPYVAAIYEIMQQMLGKSQLLYAVKAGQIRFDPLELMRGRTFDNTWVLLDEAQNCSKEQMLMFLTRIGQNCKVIINGDPEQSDMKHSFGLPDAINRLEAINDVAFVTFDLDDIVRSDIVKDIIICYNKP